MDADSETSDSSDNNAGFDTDAEFDDGLSSDGGASISNVPRCAQYRNNLTAFCQYYNLYFAVYGEELHCFKRKSCPLYVEATALIRTSALNVQNMLPPSASLVIHYPVWGHGDQLGFVDPSHPHFANHMITGNLGANSSTEIVLLACTYLAWATESYT